MCSSNYFSTIVKFVAHSILLVSAIGCGEGDTPLAGLDMGPERILNPPDVAVTPDLNIISPTSPDRGENSTCEDETTRPCIEGCGQERCVAGIWDGNCQSVLETCNDHDDNCNGIVDEAFIELGLNTQCSKTLENSCETLGVWLCDASGQALICDAPSVVPATEQCDGEDNDCDGTVDEGFVNTNCCTQAYQCPLGQLCEEMHALIQTPCLPTPTPPRHV